jgi:hypothetical protein
LATACCPANILTFTFSSSFPIRYTVLTSSFRNGTELGRGNVVCECFDAASALGGLHMPHEQLPEDIIIRRLVEPVLVTLDPPAIAGDAPALQTW